MTNIEVDSEKIKELYLRIDDLKEENKRTKATLKAYAKQVERLEEENKKLKEDLEWYKAEQKRLVDKLIVKWATELLDRKFESKKWWQWV